MPNTILTPQVIANELLRRSLHEMSFSRTINHAYDERFGKSGMKIGDTVNARIPVKFRANRGSNLVIQDVKELSVPVKINQELNVGFEFDSKDQALNIDDFSERYLKGASLAIANTVDSDGLQLAYQSCFNTVGTPGTIPNTSKTYTSALAKLTKAGAPLKSGDRYVIMSPDMNVEAVDAMKGLFNNQSEISKINLGGYMGTWNGAKWAVDQNVRTHTVGPLGGTPAVSGANQSGKTLNVSGFSASAALRLRKGDTFTIAGCYAVSTFGDTLQDLREFVVTADVESDSAGLAAIPVSPEIIVSGPYQTVSAAPTNGALLTVSGAANTATPQGLVYDKDFISLACGTYDLPQGCHLAARASDPDTKVSLRITGQFDIHTGKFIYRVDCMYGWASLLPQFSCRVQS